MMLSTETMLSTGLDSPSQAGLCRGLLALAKALMSCEYMQAILKTTHKRCYTRR